LRWEKRFLFVDAAGQAAPVAGCDATPLVEKRRKTVTKNLLCATFAFAVVLLAAAPSAARPYAQLSSSESQMGAAAPTVVTLNQEDALSGITNSKGAITFQEAGTYFLMAAAQLGSSDGYGKGTVRLWMRQNGQDVGNSNTEQTIVDGFTAVLVCQGVAEIKAGDKIELVFSTSKPGQKLGLIASKPKGEPAVPSMIFSAFKADDNAYAQLSSSDTQTAAAAAKTITLNSIDAAKNVENDKGVVTVKQAGTYFVMAAGQVGNSDAAAKAPAASGSDTVRLWMRQNGQDVANSNTAQTISGSFTGVLVCQGIMECKAGDKIELQQAAAGSGLGMIASAPKGEPVIPSMILSIVRVGDAAYAQLSSSETQAGKEEGGAVTLNQTDAAKEIERDKGSITIKKAGAYFVIAAGQVANANGNGKGSARLWVRQNGQDVANSNTEQTIVDKYTAVLVCQGVGEAKAGDKLQLWQSAKGSAVGMVASTPKGEPVVPSMIFSLVKVD
jgi:hypothetical protein